MGIAGRVDQVALSLDLRTGVYAFRVVESQDMTVPGKEGKPQTKTAVSIVIEKARPGSKDKAGDKVKQMNFFTDNAPAQTSLLCLYAALKGEGKEPMDPEAYQEWPDRDAFAKRLEIRLPAQPKAPDYIAFGEAQKELAGMMLRGEVTVTESQSGYPRFEFAPVGTLDFSAESTAAGTASAATAAKSPAQARA